jgi:arylsulfatase
MTGKHHGEENPIHFGFDRYFGLKDGSSNHFNPGTQREGEVTPAHKMARFPRSWGIDSTLYEPYTPEEDDFYTTDYFTNHAIKYLEEYKNESKPFFLYIAYTAPHDPLMAWPEDQQKYLGKYMAGYEAVRKARYERQVGMGLLDENYPLSPPTYEDWNSLSQEEKLMRDSIMGRYTSLSLSWANVSDTPFRLYKTNSHEGGISTPLVVYWKGHISTPGSIIDFPSHLIDVMPTILEITGTDYPQTYNGERINPVDGISFLPLLEGGEVERDEPLFWQWKDGKAIRKSKWKLVSDHNGPWELYDMESDQTETRNLINEFPEIAQDLEVQWVQWMKK